MSTQELLPFDLGTWPEARAVIASTLESYGGVGWERSSIVADYVIHALIAAGRVVQDDER